MNKQKEESPCKECANYGFGCPSPITIKSWIADKNLFREYRYLDKPDCFELDIRE